MDEAMRRVQARGESPMTDRESAEAIARVVLAPRSSPASRETWRARWLLMMIAGALAGAGLAIAAGGLPQVWAFAGAIIGALGALAIAFIHHFSESGSRP
jgi:hypothetical protein